MNLIEQLGGYDSAKRYLEELRKIPLHEQTEDTITFLPDELLEYRRANNIFDVGDKVVYRALPHERLFNVRFVGDDEIVVYELWDEMGAKTFTEKHPYSDIDHATDKEIAAGHRL